LRLSAKGKRAVKRLRSATLKVEVTMTPADGGKVTATRTVKVKR